MPVEFVDGFRAAEDLALLGDSGWMITSSMQPDPQTFFVHVQTRERVAAYPQAMRVAGDRAIYPDAEPVSGGIFHGLAVRAGADGIHTVYQINHAGMLGSSAETGREAVEVFEVDTRGAVPSLTWVGAVPLPPWAVGNDLCVLPDGGFAVTNMRFAGDDFRPRLLEGGPTGNVIEWRGTDLPWRIAEGTDLNLPNGIEVSPDGRYYYVSLTARRELVRIRRDDPHGDRRTIRTPFMGDNLTWGRDGRLLLTGQDTDIETMLAEFADPARTDRGYPFGVVAIDPDTLECETVAWHAGSELVATTAVDAGGEYWIGSSHGTRIAVVSGSA
ncbi:MAG: SMP-30/gluconolactonase/LRE family protein [Microbacterium sp.]